MVTGRALSDGRSSIRRYAWTETPMSPLSSARRQLTDITDHAHILEIGTESYRFREIDLRPVLLNLKRRTGVAVAADRNGHQLAIGGSHFEALLLLALRSSLIGGIGNTGPTPSYILRR